MFIQESGSTVKDQTSDDALKKAGPHTSKASLDEESFGTGTAPGNTQGTANTSGNVPKERTEKKYVNYQSCRVGVPGSKKGVTGIRFSLAPMSDEYIRIILGAIQKVDLSKVWAKTDETSTVYRGRTSAVFDACAACFHHAYQDKIHMMLEMTISKGCPGDVDADYALEFSDEKVNHESIRDIHFPVTAKFALYPMGDNNYMQLIENVVNEAVDRGIFHGTGHYTSFLKGDSHAIFDYLEWVAQVVGKEVSHYIIEATLLCNLPKEDL